MHKAYKPEEPPESFDYWEDCPECGNSIPIVVDSNEKTNYEVICPACGKPLLLCGQCHWDDDEHWCCDWCPAHGCFRQRMKK